MRVAYHPAVQRDASRILQHYDRINDTLGDEFWEELNSFIRQAAANPQRFHFQTRDRRRVNLKRFPRRMFKSHLHQIDQQTTRITLSDGSSALSFRQVIDLWQTSEGFRSFFTAVISECAFDAFFWETAPVMKRTLDRSFEFVLVGSASLSRLIPDPSPFTSHFSSQGSEVILTFPNLGGDALLVVPVPLADKACYTHLARFLRDAPRSQVDAFWRSAGCAMQERVSDAPTWLSTAGMGVSWLHLRLDSRPKYYCYEPYKTNA